jgi:hypothetical protein
MILLFCFSSLANLNWETKINNIEASSTQLKSSLQQLQILSTLSNNASLPVASILSLADLMEVQVKSIENQINQMDRIGQ